MTPPHGAIGLSRMNGSRPPAWLDGPGDGTGEGVIDLEYARSMPVAGEPLDVAAGQPVTGDGDHAMGGQPGQQRPPRLPPEPADEEPGGPEATQAEAVQQDRMARRAQRSGQPGATVEGNRKGTNIDLELQPLQTT